MVLIDRDEDAKTAYPNSEKDPPRYVINAVRHPSIIKLCCGL
jgi:hypothetical protein